MFLHAPTTADAIMDPPEGLYTSAAPDHWLDVAQMAELIQEGIE
jgi:hypothetical protein